MCLRIILGEYKSICLYFRTQKRGNMTNKTQKLCNLTTSNHFLNRKLKTLGIGEDYKAYYYLINIMDEMINNEMQVRSFSRQMYPLIAKKLEIREWTIERDIRHIINVLWDYKLKNKLSMFWGKVERPSCCQFIYIIKDYIVQDII